MNSRKTTLAGWGTLSVGLFSLTRHRMFLREAVRLRATYSLPMREDIISEIKADFLSCSFPLGLVHCHGDGQ